MPKPYRTPAGQDPSQPTPTPVDPVEQLAREADAAQRMRTLSEHADVVALRVERVRTHVERILWVAIGLGLGFTVPNVHAFYIAVTGAGPGSLLWWSGWLVEPMLALVLIAILRAEQITSRHGERLTRGPQLLKWGGVTATYTMNTWTHWAHLDWAGIVAHSVPPVIVLVAAAALPAVHESLTRSTTAAHRRAVERHRELATEHAAGQATDTGPSVLDVASANTPTSGARRSRTRTTRTNRTAAHPAPNTGTDPATNTAANSAADGVTNGVGAQSANTPGTPNTAPNSAENGAGNGAEGSRNGAKRRLTAHDYAAIAAPSFTGDQDARWVREVTGCGRTTSYEVLRILNDRVSGGNGEQRPGLYAVGDTP